MTIQSLIYVTKILLVVTTSTYTLPTPSIIVDPIDRAVPEILELGPTI